MKYIDDKQFAQWNEIAAKLQQANDLVALCYFELLTKLNITEGKALDSIIAVEETIAGLPYMFTPQQEWTGGGSSNQTNFKFRQPRIMAD